MSSSKPKVFQKSAVAVWDITVKMSEIKKDDLIKWMDKYCKSWTFQGEKGQESGYEHWQCRISLKVKERTPFKKFPVKECSFSPTCGDNKDNAFYVMKDDTRIEGPYNDENDSPEFVSEEMKDVKLKPFQQQIVDDALPRRYNNRKINLLYDEKGCGSKSFVAEYVRTYKIGTEIPYSSNYKDMMRMVYGLPKRKLYVLDLPRALNKHKLQEYIAAIETIKDGKAYDDRFKFKPCYFPKPNIWVFTNVLFNTEMLSADRWMIWEFDKTDKEKLVLIKGHNYPDYISKDEKKKSEEKQMEDETWRLVVNEFDESLSIQSDED